MDTDELKKYDGKEVCVFLKDNISAEGKLTYGPKYSSVKSEENICLFRNDEIIKIIRWNE